MCSIFFRCCLFLIAFTVLTLGSCKKPPKWEEKIEYSNYEYHYIIDYDANLRMLGRTCIYNSDTTSIERYSYADSLVVCNISYPGQGSRKLTYHLLGSLAWKSTDSFFDQAGICKYASVRTHAYYQNNYCKWILSVVRYFQNAGPSGDHQINYFYDEPINGNVEGISGSHWYSGSWGATSKFSDKSAKIRPATLLGFLGENDKNLPESSVSANHEFGSGTSETKYTHVVDANGFLLETHEDITSKPLNYDVAPRNKTLHKIARRFYFEYHLK